MPKKLSQDKIAKIVARHNRVSLRYERTLFRRINRELKRAYGLYSRGFISRSFNQVTWRAEHRKNIRSILEKHYTQMVPVFSGFVEDMIDRDLLGKKTTDDEYQAIVTTWVDTTALAKATMIASTTDNQAKGVITRGVTEALTDAEIAAGLRRLANLSSARALTIARTETGNASSFISLQKARNIEETAEVKLLKKWVPINDGRTRDDHAAMASHAAIPLDEYFTVGGSQGMRPRGEGLPADEVVNCRCAMVYEEG